MSQATLLGICSDNVVTILQPSSTIECPLGPGSCSCSGSGSGSTACTPPTQYGPFNITGGTTTIPLNMPGTTVIVSGFVTFEVQSVTGTPGSVSVIIGSFSTAYPIPTGFVGPVILPFQTIVSGSTTLTLLTTEGASITLFNKSYSYNVVRLC